MDLVDLPLKSIVPAPWNANELDEAMKTRLRRSVERFGLVVPLVVRRVTKERYETIGGAQRLWALGEMGAASVPCVVVEADDAEARLLSQALNRISGEDNLGLRAGLVRSLMSSLSTADIIAVVPETVESLQALASLGQGDIADQLREFERAQKARLKHLQFQLTPVQLEIVEEALEHALAGSMKEEGSPNKRGTALTAICRGYLRRGTAMAKETNTYTPAYRRRAS